MTEKGFFAGPCTFASQPSHSTTRAARHRRSAGSPAQVRHPSLAFLLALLPARKPMICQDRLGTKRKESVPNMACFHADFRLQRTSILGANFYIRKNHIAASGIRTLSGPQPRQLLYEEPLGARKRHAVLPSCLMFVLSLSRQIDRFLSFSDVCPEPVSANHSNIWID